MIAGSGGWGASPFCFFWGGLVVFLGFVWVGFATE